METSKVTRFEVIDHTPCEVCKGHCFIVVEGQTKPEECPECNGLGAPGRAVVFWDENKELFLSLQDDGRTLKVFINRREVR